MCEFLANYLYQNLDEFLRHPIGKKCVHERMHYIKFVYDTSKEVIKVEDEEAEEFAAQQVQEKTSKKDAPKSATSQPQKPKMSLAERKALRKKQEEEAKKGGKPMIVRYSAHEHDLAYSLGLRMFFWGFFSLEFFPTLFLAGNRYCDECTKMTTGSPVYHCEECDYDMCMTCQEKEEKKTPSPKNLGTGTCTGKFFGWFFCINFV
jgi:hypothetical protein